MPLIMNCLDEPNTAVVGGNYFTFKAGQIKPIHQEGIARIISQNKRDDGFVELPDELDGTEYPDWAQTPEGKALIAQKKREGIETHCAHLRQVVYNLQVSLKQDLEKQNIKADPRVFASKGEIAALEKLVKYQDKEQDQDQLRIDRVKELEKKMGSQK